MSRKIYVLDRGPEGAHIVVASDVEEAMDRISEDLPNWHITADQLTSCELDEVITTNGAYVE